MSETNRETPVSNTDGSAIVTAGHAAFSRGSMGNGGQNLYVSRAGVLQRIFQFDLNRNGYLDLVFCNSQDHWERPPAFLYPAPLDDPGLRIDLPAEGALSGVVTDLNGDGHDDLVIANHYGGITFNQNSTVYFGGPHGLTERYRQELPAPCCTSAAAGDFNGNGRIDIALLSNGKVRLFPQDTIGYEPKRFVDLDIEADQIDAADLDGDACDELIVRSPTGEVRVYWGGPDGIDAAAPSVIPVAIDPDAATEDDDDAYVEYVDDAMPLVRVIHIDNRPHIYVARADAAHFVPVERGRRFGEPLVIECAGSLSVASGDVDGDGRPDLAFACRDERNGDEHSWIYWGGPDGYEAQHRTPLATHRACDVALADLDGDGRDEIVICQSKTLDMFSTESLVLRMGTDRKVTTRTSLASEDARRVFIVRTANRPDPQVVIINHFARRVCGDVDIAIYHGGPEGYSAQECSGLPGFGAVEALCCDVNDDGYVDIVLANCAENAPSRDPGSFVYFGSEEGFKPDARVTLPTTRAHGVACADLDRDGYIDLVFCGFSMNELLIFYGSEQGYGDPVRLRMEYDGVVYDDPRWIYLVDLNHDGWLDLVVPQISADRSFILWGGPDGFSMDRCQALSVFHAASARAADLNGNGYLDLVIAGHMPSEAEPQDTFVCIYWNGPDGLREDRRTLLPARGANAMTLADFNGDGLLDLFVCSYHGIGERDIDSYIYWNRKDRGFSAADRQRLFMHSASGCVAADLNDSGCVDLAVAYHKVYGDHVGHSAVWWNGPEGFDDRRITRLPTSGPHGMTCIETGNILDRGPEEHYVSEPFEIPQGALPTRISWEAGIPPRSWVNAQLRTADSREQLDKAEWAGPGGPGSRYERGDAIPDGAARGRWLQYRLALGAEKSLRTPRVTEVRIDLGDG